MEVVPTVGEEGRILFSVCLEELEEEVDEFPVPAPRIPKAHKAYGFGSKTTRGRGFSDQPRRNVRLRLGY